MADRRNSQMQRGSGIYKCTDCGKMTRDTGTGEASSVTKVDGKLVGSCAACWDFAGWENHHSDHGHNGSYAKGEWTDDMDTCPVCQKLGMNEKEATEKAQAIEDAKADDDPTFDVARSREAREANTTDQGYSVWQVSGGWAWNTNDVETGEILKSGEAADSVKAVEAAQAAIADAKLDKLDETNPDADDDSESLVAEVARLRGLLNASSEREASVNRAWSIQVEGLEATIKEGQENLLAREAEAMRLAESRDSLQEQLSVAQLENYNVEQALNAQQVAACDLNLEILKLRKQLSEAMDAVSKAATEVNTLRANRKLQLDELRDQMASSHRRANEAVASAAAARGATTKLKARYEALKAEYKAVQDKVVKAEGDRAVLVDRIVAAIDTLNGEGK